MTAWTDGFNEGYDLASKNADAWIVIYSILSFIFGALIGLNLKVVI